jgi:hypothetical protein
MNSGKRIKIGDKVSIFSAVGVILIPTTDEYRQAKNSDGTSVADNLWYTRNDYHFFQDSAKKEVVAYISSSPDATPRQALTALYQPNNTLDEVVLANPSPVSSMG